MNAPARSDARSPYEVHPAFGALFRTFTNDAQSIGTDLTRALEQASRDDPLLVSTASDIVLFPGRGAPAQVESFRRSTRGFIELTAVSHVPLSLAYVARMRELEPTSTEWRTRLDAVRTQAQAVRQVNTVAMWRDDVGLPAFGGLEQKITDMVEYTLAVTCSYIDRALDNPSLLDFEALRANYFDPATEVLPVSMNDIMFSTFALAYIDIAYRIGNWLRGQALDWQRAMVLVSGRSGRPTAGATWSSNNMCHLVWRTTGLPPERLYVAPHAPGFSVQNLPDASGMVELEQTYRRLWCHTRASVEVSRRMFDGYAPYQFTPNVLEAMPPITSVGDRTACIARLRRIMEDPQQLLSNCVADYVVDELQRCGNRPELVPIPGFTNVEFPK
jgi:hypothetical protein